MKTCPCKSKTQVKLGWIVPTIVLALVPKCPLCVVAYAAWLGVGISVSMATAIRYGVIVACAIALVVVVVRALVASRSSRRRAKVRRR